MNTNTLSQRNGTIRGQQCAFSGLRFGFSKINAPDFKADPCHSRENHRLDLLNLPVPSLMFFWFSIFSLSSPEWHGMLYSQADSKKKSNLMMSLFEPGPEPLPWLGKMAQLGPISGITQIRFYLSWLCFLSAVLNGWLCSQRAAWSPLWVCCGLWCWIRTWRTPRKFDVWTLTL